MDSIFANNIETESIVGNIKLLYPTNFLTFTLLIYETDYGHEACVKGAQPVVASFVRQHNVIHDDLSVASKTTEDDTRKL